MTSESPFPHPFWKAYFGVGPEARCLDEWKIIDISNAIRAKVDWTRKYKDETISSKWKAEIKEQFGDDNVIDAILDYVFRELEWYDALQKQYGFAIELDDRIVSSATAVSEKTRKMLMEQSDQLLESFGSDVDYHPGSNNQVIDLVHPSLFPLVYGRTKILKRDNLTELITAAYDDLIANVKKGVEDFGVSKNYQWLPSQFKWDKESELFLVGSYINNLHPVKFKLLYKTIADVFNQAIPGLNLVLSRFASEQYYRINVPQFGDAYTQEYHEKLDALEEELENEDEFDDVRLEEFMDTRGDYIKELLPKYESDPTTKNFDLTKFDKINVIVKLANIELTPENPVYPGGSWHVEGTINENIVATVLYYYDIENITESTLSYRTAFEDPHYEQGDEFYCEHYFGIADGADMVRELGSTKAETNKLVIFPNSFQHHVDGFELLDKSKKGHRKILCFFLCDPYNEKVVSTSEVPPQQKEWWEDAGIKELVPEVVRKQLDNSQMELSEAKEIRELLMKERSSSPEDPSDLYAYQRQFSLCEH